MTEQQAEALARIELCRVALAAITLDSGGRLKISDEGLTHQPVGILQIGWTRSGDIECRYTPQNNAPPVGEPTVLALGILTYRAGGRLLVKGVNKMPNGTFGFLLEDDGIVFVYQQDKPRIH